MRWDALFEDLEGRAAALEQSERAAEIGERTRGEIGALGLLERYRAAVGAPLRVHLLGGLVVAGEVRRVGPDWLLVTDGGAGRTDGDGAEALVRPAAIARVRGLTRYSAAPNTMSVVESRLGLRHVLRGVARDRSNCRVHLVDGSLLEATIDRVGADFLEVAAGSAGEPRRRADVREVETVPFTALAAVRRSR